MSIDVGRRAGPGRKAGPGEAEGLPLSRAIWAISLPILFAEISEIIIHVTDTIFLARVGTKELAAIALGDAIRELWIVPVIGLVEAAQIVIARRHGQSRTAAVGATFNHSFRMVLLVSLALMVSLRLGSGPLSRAVGDGAVAGAVDDFLRIASFGVIFQGLNLVYSSLYVAVSRTRVLVRATIVLALTNVALSYVLIFGKLGFPRLGIEGAAIALVGAEIATFVFLTLHTLRRPDLRRFGLFRRDNAGDGGPIRLARLSAPVALEAFVEAIRWVLFFVILEQVGEEALAWSNIVYACYAIFLIPTEAFCETATSMVSNVIGFGRAERIRGVVRNSVAATYVVTVPVLAAVAAFPRFALSIFTSDPDVIAGSAGILRLVALAIMVIIPAEIWLAAVFGTGDTDAALALEFVGTAAMLTFAFVAAVVLELDVVWVWVALPLASVVALPLSYAWVKAGYWRRRAI